MNKITMKSPEKNPWNPMGNHRSPRHHIKPSLVVEPSEKIRLRQLAGWFFPIFLEEHCTTNHQPAVVWIPWIVLLLGGWATEKYQLGWWNSQLNGKIWQMYANVPNHQPAWDVPHFLRETTTKDLQDLRGHAVLVDLLTEGDGELNMAFCNYPTKELAGWTKTKMSFNIMLPWKRKI